MKGFIKVMRMTCPICGAEMRCKEARYNWANPCNSGKDTAEVTYICEKIKGDLQHEVSINVKTMEPSETEGEDERCEEINESI